MRQLKQSKSKWSRSVLGVREDLGEVCLEERARVVRVNGMKA
jgi:hypothetical protein